MNDDWILSGATPTKQSVTADWQFIDRPLIAGVRIKEVRNVPTGHGYMTEIFRRDWALDDAPVTQVFQGTFSPGQISAWHAHEHTIDRLFVNQGQMRIVLYDRRPDSETRGMITEMIVGTVRPALISVPPKVWHGVQNLDGTTGRLINLVDHAYDYKNPDHWNLDWDSPAIPFRFRK